MIGWWGSWGRPKTAPLRCGGSSPMVIGLDHLACHDLFADVLVPEGPGLKRLSTVGLPD